MKLFLRIFPIVTCLLALFCLGMASVSAAQQEHMVLWGTLKYQNKNAPIGSMVGFYNTDGRLLAVHTVGILGQYGDGAVGVSLPAFSSLKSVQVWVGGSLYIVPFPAVRSDVVTARCPLLLSSLSFTASGVCRYDINIPDTVLPITLGSDTQTFLVQTQTGVIAFDPSGKVVTVPTASPVAGPVSPSVLFPDTSFWDSRYAADTQTPADAVLGAGRPSGAVVSTVTSVSTPPKTQKQFKDIQGHFAESAIKELVSAGVIQGYDDDTFRPNQPVTRAEMVKMVLKSSKKDKTLVPWDSRYTDVFSSQWFYDSVRLGVAAWLLDTSHQKFRPNDGVTRAEWVKLLLVGMDKKVTDTGKLAFSDVFTFAWYTPYIKTAARLKIAQGYTDGTFRPDQGLTRGELAVLLVRAR